MQNIRKISWLVAVLVVLAGINANAAEKKDNPSLIVLPIEAHGVQQTIADSLTDLLVLELQKANMYTVIAQDDLKSLLEHAQVKQLIGVDSEEELAKVGQQLQADYLLRSSLGKVGATYLLSLTLIDVKEAKAARRVNQSLNGDPEDLIGSLHSAVVALALEEKGMAPDITAPLIESLNIAQKIKHLFISANIGYELPIGNMTDKDDVAYALPDLLNIRLSAEWHLKPYLRLIAESGLDLSIAQQYNMQNKRIVATPDGSGGVDTTTVVTTTQFDFATIRIPFSLMARLQPSSGRLLPFVLLGLGMSWQKYSFDNEKLEILDDTKSSNGTCSAPYTATASGHCLRKLELEPMEDSVNFINLHVPFRAGIDYLLTQHFGFGVSANYLLTFAVNKSDDDLTTKFITYDSYTDSNGNTVKEGIGDIVPVRRLHHGLSVMSRIFFYF